MPDVTSCFRKTCHHAVRVHADDDGACRVTGCDCERFLDKPEAMQGKRPTTRRVAIDVPDGYTLSMSLIPWSDQDPVIDVDSETGEAVDGS
jgi:hypothetical protein